MSPLLVLLLGTVAFATVLVTTPLAGLTARRVGAVAAPGERHVHLRATPTLGGLALFAGLLAAVAAASRVPELRAVFRDTNEPEAVVLAGLLVVIVGVVDDTRGMSAPAKLAGQILAAGVLVLNGVALRYVYLPGLGGAEAQALSLSPDLSALCTIVLVVAMMNAVNLVDGLDGLAAGVVAIAAAALLVYYGAVAPSLAEVPTAAPVLLAAAIGVCAGFLFHNFNPASIFMGDTGSMLLGLVLGAGGVLTVGSSFSPPDGGAFVAGSLPVLLPAFVLAVPFLDTAWTILRRLRQGRAIFAADKEHLHHRLLEIGHSHRRAVLIMWYWSALLAFAAVGGALLDGGTVAGLALLGGSAALTAAAVGRLRRRLT